MHPARLSALATSLLALLLAAGPARADAPFHVHVDTIVPDVRGLLEAQAVTGLEAVYEIEVVEVFSSVMDDGRVVRQRPRAGERLAFRGAIRLEVGHAAVEIPLPSLVGLDLADAERTLLDRGIVPVPVFHRIARRGPARTPRSGPARPEVGKRTATTVRRQDPAPGTLVRPEAQVTLHVSLLRVASHRVRVPSLHGLTSAQAVEALGTLGLTLRIRRKPSVFARETIVEQTPATGTHLRRGSVVQLVVAFPAGRTHVPAQVEVPNLRGARLPEAFRLARAAGIRLRIGRRPAFDRVADRVLRQRPTAGVRVPLGTTIRISTGREIHGRGGRQNDGRKPAGRPFSGPSAAVPPRR